MVRLSGPGGHTARPHLTADLVYALGKIVTELPAALSRRVNPRSSLSLVWGKMSAGSALNAIPEVGMAAGTVRCLDEDAWHQAPDLLKALLNSVANAYGVVAELEYIRGVPPAVNDAGCVDILQEAVEEAIGPGRRHRGAAEPGRRGRRLVLRVDSGRAGPARHPGHRDADRSGHPPGQLRHRREGARHRGEGAGHRRADRAGQRGAAGDGRAVADQLSWRAHSSR